MAGVSYAGVDLSFADAGTRAWVASSIPVWDDLDWRLADWPVWNAHRKWWQLPLSAFRVVPGRLTWPTGAARWAFAYFLATDNQLADIRTAVYDPNDTNKYVSGSLVMDDGRTGRSVTASMWMLPPRPLYQISGKNGVNLLLLVDERFFWWDRSASIAVTEGTTTWANLFSSIATGLNITLTTDTVSSNYLKPSSALTARYESLPLLLDAACWSVGHRFVRKLDGACVTQAATTAKTSQDAQLTSWTKIGGGQFAFDESTTNDLAPLVPSSVDCVFPRLDVGTPNVSPYVVNKTLAGLSLTEFGSTVGYVGKKVLKSTAAAYYDATPTLQNGTELGNLATQMATDFYRWKLGRQDTRSIGIAPYVIEGLSDRVEWEWLDFLDFGTRVRRGPAEDVGEPMAHSGATYGSSDECCGEWTVTGTDNVQTAYRLYGEVITPTSGSQIPLTILPQSGATPTYDIAIYKAGDSGTTVWTVDRFGGQIITPDSTSSTALTINQYPSSTADLIDLIDSSNVTQISVDENFKLDLRESTTSTASLNIPTGTAPTTPVAGDIWADSGGLEYYDGTTTHTIAGGSTVPGIYVLTSGATVTGSTSETTLVSAGQGSLTVAANSLAAGSCLRVRASGSISLTSPRTATVRLKIGSSVYGHIVFQNSLGGTISGRWFLDLDAVVLTAGGSGTTKCVAEGRTDSGSFVIGSGSDTPSIDTTASNTLDLTAQLSNGSDSIGCDLFTVERVY